MPTGIVILAGKGGALFAAQGDIPVNILKKRQEFAGCDSEGKLFGFELALGHDHEIHSRRQ